MKNSSLFIRLLFLYRKVSIFAVRIRMRSYRQHVKSDTALNITALLKKEIDELVVSSDQNIKHSSNISEEPHSSNLIIPKADNEHSHDVGIKNTHNVESEFANYLKQNKSSLIIHPYMGDKLKKSAWEHIHCTIRHARLGHIDMAKLHADIAGHALEEAAHYMSDEEYSELIFDIEKCFKNSK
jgi:hypothetical protein